MRRAVRSGWATAGRGDWDVMLARYAPDVVWEVPREFRALGFAELYRGHNGMREALAQFGEAFEWWEIRPACMLDLGDRLLTLGTFRGLARTSGVEWKQQFAQLLTLVNGAVASEQGFYAWEEGLREAGLDPREVERLRLRSPQQLSSL